MWKQKFPERYKPGQSIAKVKGNCGRSLQSFGANNPNPMGLGDGWLAHTAPAAMARRHPERVSHLIMADPWGVSARQDLKREIPWHWRIIGTVLTQFNPLAIVRCRPPHSLHRDDWVKKVVSVAHFCQIFRIRRTEILSDFFRKKAQVYECAWCVSELFPPPG